VRSGQTSWYSVRCGAGSARRIAVARVWRCRRVEGGKTAERVDRAAKRVDRAAAYGWRA
jgi:hypothetical protein